MVLATPPLRSFQTGSACTAAALYGGGGILIGMLLEGSCGGRRYRDLEADVHTAALANQWPEKRYAQASATISGPTGR
ncbi:hypothetical protein NUM_07920 [Actinocatenispora comari]|uniref:Uncharacterized protein n=1 Tax=Actinocatenispora comari TaxID=2807577 RepID=A0A8J4EHY9_9ACTN|nr:hypothetical protein NUM_07920 [Actinocatenispora comari]